MLLPKQSEDRDQIGPRKMSATCDYLHFSGMKVMKNNWEGGGGGMVAITIFMFSTFFFPFFVFVHNEERGITGKPQLIKLGHQITFL